MSVENAFQEFQAEKIYDFAGFSLCVEREYFPI
jgi:hypothetical protein